MHRISLILSDDHAFTRAGLQHWLCADSRFDIIGAAGNAVETIRLARSLRPDISLVDYNLPDANGQEVLIELRRWVPDCRVVILTSREDAAIVSPLLRAGAHAILSKTSPAEKLGDDLVAVMQGEQVIDAVFQTALEQDQDTVTLSAREFEVLIRLAKGMSNPAIAEDLALSAKTIESHRANLMRKLNVNSATALIVRAAKLGLIEL